MPQTLQGANIVIARAEGRGSALQERIRAEGGDCMLFPVIAIRPLAPPQLPAAPPDWLIFTSKAAVEYGLPLLRARLVENTRIATIGHATAAAIEAAGLRVDAVPAQQESEGLLDLPAFHAVKKQECWIVRGLGGRDLLAGALAARGARVALLEVYERGLPDTPIGGLVTRWRENRVDTIVVSSRSSLVNLHALLDHEGRRFLQETQLVMPTERMLKLAHELHIDPAPLIARDASDDAQMAVLQEWWRARQQDPR